jgi:hypothetical protein
MSTLRALIRGERPKVSQVSQSQAAPAAARPPGCVANVAAVAVAKALDAAPRINPDAAAADLAVMLREIARDWRAGSFAILDDDPDLWRRFTGAEQILDDIAGIPGGPLRADWTAAVAGLAAALREIIQRFNAIHERKGKV